MGKGKRKILVHEEEENVRQEKKFKSKSSSAYREVKVTVSDLLKIVDKVKKLKWVRFQFELWVDSREPPEIIQFLLGLGFFVKQKALPVGDYYYVLRNLDNGSSILFAVIERKSIPDLFSALGTTRFRTQKENLKQLCSVICLPRARVFYLIEHAFVHTKNWKSQAVLKGVKMNISLRDRMTVWETMDQTDTLYTLTFMIWKIHTFLPEYLEELSLQTSLEAARVMEYTADVTGKEEKVKEIEVQCTCHEPPPAIPWKPQSKKNLSVQDQDFKQLKHYNGVGPKAAEALLKRFESFPKLCQYINETSPLLVMNEMQNVRLESGRKVGEKTAQVIFDHLYIRKSTPTPTFPKK